MWDVGLKEYVNDMWNVVDFVTNGLYVATIALRLVAYYKVCKPRVKICSHALIEYSFKRSSVCKSADLFRKEYMTQR